MNSAKPDNALADRLDSLPLPEGVSFRAGAVWTGIDRRLRARRRRALWPRLAVAALLLLLAGAFLLLRQEAPAEPAIPVAMATDARRSTDAVPTEVRSPETGKRPDGKAVAIASTTTRPSSTRVRPLVPPVDSTVLIAATPVPAAADTAAALTALSAPAAATPVRRFRIAHINDPATPVLPEVAAAAPPDEERDPQSMLRLRRGAGGPRPESDAPSERRPRRFPFNRSPQ